MSAFPTLPELPTLSGLFDAPKPLRRAAVDGVVAANRARTPRTVIEERAQPRLSVAELNDLDMDEIRKRWGLERVDTRGPVTKFLDLIDVGRNFITGTVFPATAERKRQMGDLATGGMPRVNFSDVLEDMGVSNRVIRGVAGFVGDVAFDPLTYLGPAGWGAKVSAAGRAAQFSKAGKKVLDATIDAVRTGGQVADPALAKWLKYRGVTNADEAAKAIYGGVRTKANKAGSTWLGFDAAADGESQLARDVFAHIDDATDAIDADRILAAKDIYKKYGRPHAPGIRVVRDKGSKLGFKITTDPSVAAGSGVLHVPFTDYSLSVPGFTRGAKQGAFLSSLAQKPISAFKEGPHQDELKRLVSEFEAINYDDLRHEMNPNTEKPWTPADVRYIQDKARQKINDFAAKVQQDPLSEPADMLHAEAVTRAYMARAEELGLEADDAAAELAQLRDLKPKVTKRLEEERSALYNTRRETWAADKKHRETLWRMVDDEVQAERTAFQQQMDAIDAEVQARAQALRDAGEKPRTSVIKQTVMQEHGFPSFNEQDALDRAFAKIGTTPENVTTTPWDDIAETARAAKDAEARYRAMAPDEMIQKALSTDLEAHALEVEKLHHRYRLAQRIAASSMTPTLNAFKNGGDAANMARIALGLGDDDIGSSVLGTLGDVASDIQGRNTNGSIQAIASRVQDLARLGRTMFGLPEGRVKALQRAYIKAMNVATNDATVAVRNNMVRSLRDLGLPRDVEDKAAELVTAMVFLRDKDPRQIASFDEAGRVVTEAIQNGLLNDKVHPGVPAKLWEIAKRSRDELEALRPEGSRIEQYVPNMLTPEAEARIRYARQNFLARGTTGAGNAGRGNMGDDVVETFAMPRTSRVHVWTDAEGKTHEYMEAADFYTGYMTDPAMREQFDQLTTAQKQHITGALMEREAFHALPIEQQRLAEVRDLSPMEINRRVKQEGLFSLFSANVGGDFFLTNAADVFSRYAGLANRAARRQNYQKLLEGYAVPIDTAKIIKLSGRKGDEFMTPDGMVGRLYSENNRAYVDIGGQRFRQPVHKIHPSEAGGDITRKFYPEEIADLIDDTAGILKDDKAMSGIATAANEITALWKVSTLTHGSWIINDVIGNLFLAVANGIPITAIIKRIRDAMRITFAHARGDEDALRRILVNVHNQQVSGFDIVNAPGREFNGGHSAQEAMSQFNAAGARTVGKRVPTRDVIKGLVTGDTGPAREAWQDAVTNARAQAQGASVMGSRLGRQPYMQNARTVYSGVVDEAIYNRIWKPFAHLNGIANDWVKTAAFLAAMDTGMDSASAAKFISDRMLDMSVLTGFDKTARKMVPFWTWMKSSGVNGVRRLIDNPKFFSVTPHLRDAIEEATLGEDRIPENQRPSWIRDQLALQIGSDPDNRRALTLTNSLPTEAATYAVSFLLSPFLGAGALQDSLAYGVNSLSPAVKVPLELGARREFFTKRTIDPVAGDMTPTEYMLQQVRPLRELGIGQVREGPAIRAFKDGVVPGITRAVVGGRYQPFDEERRLFQLQRDFDDRVNVLRKRINVAERDGNKPASLQARVRLLETFAEMEKLKLKIPKWAVEQIQVVSG